MNTLIQARIDAATKKQAESIFLAMGITLNEGIRMFIRQTIHDQGLPFRPRLGDIPNNETQKAVQELKTPHKKFHSVNDLMADVLSQD